MLTTTDHIILSTYQSTLDGVLAVDISKLKSMKVFCRPNNDGKTMCFDGQSLHAFCG